MKTFPHLYLLFGLLLLSTSCEQKTESQKPFRIAIINVTPTLNGVVENIKIGVYQQGYREGIDVQFIYDGPTSSSDAVIEKAREMVEKRVDLIVGITTVVSTRVKQAIGKSDIPLIFTLVSDPVEAGLINSMNEPHYNISGVKAFPVGIKGLEWLKKTIPGIRRLYVPFNPDDKGMKSILKDLKISAKDLNIELEVAEVRTKSEVEAALKNIPKDVDAVWELGSGFWAPYLDMYVQNPIKRNLPLVGANQDWVERGALIAFGISNRSLGLQTSRYVTKVMEGTPPHSIPVELSEGHLYLNLRTAKKIGVKIPIDILKQATLIIR